MFLKMVCKKNEKFFKNMLDVKQVFVYTLRHPDTGKPERASETLKHATRQIGRARQFFIYGLSVAPRLSCETRRRIQPSGWGAGEVKEREGKGRDACRGLRRDEVLRNFGAGLHGTDESKDSLVQQFLN